MRRLLLCVPMIILLAGCGPAKVSRGEELALIIRGEYLEEAPWTASVSVTADYGRRVYQYELEAAWDGAETVLTLSAPETVAGITARLKAGESLLEYDGTVLETGPLNGEGLTPLSAIPALLEAARSGYITAVSLDGRTGVLRVDCGDPEETPGTGTETTDPSGSTGGETGTGSPETPDQPEDPGIIVVPPEEPTTPDANQGLDPVTGEPLPMGG